MSRYDSDEIQAAVLEYLENKVDANLDKVAEVCVDFVKILVTKVPNTVPNLISNDDLIQSGMIGLLASLNKYDPEKGKFTTWSYTRILGAARDSVRKMDPVSRSRNSPTVSYEQSLNLVADKSTPSPESILMDSIPDKPSSVLGKAIDSLPHRQKCVIIFQLNGLKANRISNILGVGYSQVALDKSKAMKNMQKFLRDNLDVTVNGLRGFES